MEEKILVIGGTGTLGQPVSRCLQQSGFDVRIMTRDLQKARKNFDRSFQLFDGNPMDNDCLEEALDGCYGVHISLPSEVEQQVAEWVAKLAARHGIQRISYISGATVAEEHRWFEMVNRKFLAEQAIRQSGIPYTIFCPTWVMEILPKFINQGRAAVFGKQPCPYHWVAARDIARLVATAYSLEESANKRFIILGPEAISMQDGLKRYCSTVHPEIQKVSSMPFWLVNLLATFTGNQELKSAGQMMAYFEKVGESSRQFIERHLHLRRANDHSGSMVTDDPISKEEENTMSTFLVPLSLWLHALATIVMVGHYVFTGLIYLPVFERRMRANALCELLEQVSTRLRPYFGGSLLIFLAIGTYLMLINQKYLGLGHFFDNPWSALIVIKYVLVLAFLVLGVIIILMTSVAQAG